MLDGRRLDRQHVGLAGRQIDALAAVAGGIDIRRGGAQVIVDADAAIDGDAGADQEAGIGPHADRHHHQPRGDRVAARKLHAQRPAAALVADLP